VPFIKALKAEELGNRVEAEELLNKAVAAEEAFKSAQVK